MDVLIVCHTEFGLVKDNIIIADKNAQDGVRKGALNLAKLADKYNAKISFAVMPEVAKVFPKNLNHEIGLHIHPGYQKAVKKGLEFYVGDKYLKKNCIQSSISTVLRDYSYNEQFGMIKMGKDHIKEQLDIDSKFFVSGRWSVNNDTIRALINAGFTHDCSAPPHSKPCHHDWSRLPRICMPYHPSERDYQVRGGLAILLIPISQLPIGSSMNPENAPFVGLPWLKACFIEYSNLNVPLFHICLHSPAMTDCYFYKIMDELLKFISKYDVKYKYVSEIKEYRYCELTIKPDILPYIKSINKELIKYLATNSIQNFKARI